MAGESILIIEPDEALLKTVIEQILLPHGFKPLAARNLEEGLKIALNNAPQLLVLHLSIDSSAYLLNNLAHAGHIIPTILVAPESTHIPLDFPRLGVRDYLEYPFTPEQVLLAFHRVLPLAADELKYQRGAEGLDRINRELEQRIKEFDLLFKIGRSVTSLLDLDVALKRVTEAAVFITGAEEGYLLLLDVETGELRLRAAQNLGDKQARGFSLQVSDSIAGQVIQSGKPVLLDGEDKQTFKVKTGYLVKSLLNVPLKTDKGVIGVLGVDNQVANAPFTLAHLNLLSTLADLAAIALENARQYSEMRQRMARQVKEFATLQAIAGQLGSVADFDMRARLALSLILSAINAEAGVLAWKAGQHQDSPRYISQGALNELAFRQVEMPEHWWVDQAVQDVLKTGQPVLRNNFKLNGNSHQGGARSQLVVPMRRGKQVIGAINIESSAPHVFTQTDLHFVSSVANQVAIALEGTLLQDKADTDRQRLFMLLSAIDHAVWLVDTDLRIVAQNEAADELLGRSSAETAGILLHDLLPANGHSPHQLCQLCRQSIATRQAVSFDKKMMLVAKDNSAVPLRGKITPMLQGDQVVGAVCTLQRVMPENSENLVRLEFANMAAHLLRTPLSFIQTSIDLLLNSELEAEEQQAMLDRMWERSRSLTEFTDELLEILRFENGSTRVYLEPVALASLVEHAIDLIQQQETCYTFNSEGFNDLPAVAADTTKTELVLFNLLTNAVARQPKGGQITIKANAAPTEISISILDAGEPISARQLDRVFGQFYPVDDDNGKMPSTYQLGLYTTRRLVEAQNGQIWAKSGQITEFGFSLPLWKGKQP